MHEVRSEHNDGGEALKPCAHCGQPAKLEFGDPLYVGEYVVRCTECRILTHPGPKWKVVLAWNRRVEPK